MKAEQVASHLLGCAPGDPGVLVRRLRERGHTDEVLLAAGIVGDARGRPADRMRGRLVFPIVDRDGVDIVRFLGRDLALARPSPAKYLNTPTTPLYRKGDLLMGLG